MGDVDVQRGRRVLRRAVSPQVLREPVERDDAACVDREDGEKCALFGPPSGSDTPSATTSSGPRIRNSRCWPRLPMTPRRRYQGRCPGGTARLAARKGVFSGRRDREAIEIARSDLTDRRRHHATSQAPPLRRCRRDEVSGPGRRWTVPRPVRGFAASHSGLRDEVSRSGRRLATSRSVRGREVPGPDRRPPRAWRLSGSPPVGARRLKDANPGCGASRGRALQRRPL